VAHCTCHHGLGSLQQELGVRYYAIHPQKNHWTSGLGYSGFLASQNGIGGIGH
jgi:hypothetical protein